MGIDINEAAIGNVGVTRHEAIARRAGCGGHLSRLFAGFKLDDPIADLCNFARHG